MFLRDNILFIGAHPDDLEISCYGTILKLSENNNVHVLVLSQNEPSRELTEETFYFLNQCCIHIENLIMGRFKVTQDEISIIDKLIDNHYIDTIFTHSGYDTNQDHVAVFQMTLAACRRKFITIIEYQSISSTIGFPVNMVIDISNRIKQKRNVIARYKEIFPQRKYFTNDFVNTFSTNYLAQLANVEYCEQFHIHQFFICQ